MVMGVMGAILHGILTVWFIVGPADERGGRIGTESDWFEQARWDEWSLGGEQEAI